MAKCQQCGKGPQFGNNRPWSKKATRRRWNVNIQKVSVLEDGKQVSSFIGAPGYKAPDATAAAK